MEKKPEQDPKTSPNIIELKSGKKCFDALSELLRELSERGVCDKEGRTPLRFRLKEDRLYVWFGGNAPKQLTAEEILLAQKPQGKIS